MAAPGSDNARESLPEIYRLQAEAAQRESREEWEKSLADRIAAVRSNPNAAELYIEMAKCHGKLKNPEAAIAVLAAGIKHCSYHSSLYLWYIHLLAQCNRTREAIAAAHEAASFVPREVLMKLKEASLLPIIYESPQEIDDFRDRITKGLHRLCGELLLGTPDERRSALTAIENHVNVHLGYQARNDRELQILYGGMVHRIMAANFPQWTVALPMPPVRVGSLRVGYVSSRFRNLSATKYFLGWIRQHTREQFAIHVYHVGGKTDATTEEVRRASRHFHQLSNSIEETCQAIRADELHILVFLDIGIAPVMSQLAALRLAPIQCAAWDQPITTGLPTVDYFLSGDLAEPEDAQDHYSETLVRLPGTGTYYQKPIIPTVLLNKARRDFQLREGAFVYLCCQYAFKYLPQQDDCFVQIAQRVPDSQFVFLTPNDFVARDFRRRLDRAFSAAGLSTDDYCVFLPELERFQYWNLLLLGDAVLDTMDWSGGVSTFEAIACREPVVTLPGKFMRGRQSCAILQQLGVTETIARNKEDYVAIATRLGLDRPWRDSVVEKMVAGYPLLYSDKRCVQALEEFYRRAVDERLARNQTAPAAVSDPGRA